VAQLVEHLTLDLSSGLDLRIVSSSPALGSMLGLEPTLKKKKKVTCYKPQNLLSASSHVLVLLKQMTTICLHSPNQVRQSLGRDTPQTSPWDYLLRKMYMHII